MAIVVALDHSSSMNTVDFPTEPKPNTKQVQASIARLDAAKSTFARFVEGRPDDLIGLVVFANDPDLACPPTLDHAFLIEKARAVRSARPDEDGTNIGDAIVWSLDALRDASSKRKVLILLTDGRNSPARVAGAPPSNPRRRRSWPTSWALRCTRLPLASREDHPYDGAGHQARPRGRRGRRTRPRPARTTGPGRRRPVVRRPRRRGPRPRLPDHQRGSEKSPVRGEVRTRYREEYAPWVGLAAGLSRARPPPLGRPLASPAHNEGRGTIPPIDSWRSPRLGPGSSRIISGSWPLPRC